MNDHEHVVPRRPTHMPDHAETCVQALVDAGLNDKISLGGALGLLHYVDYRSTRDVDAWWQEGTTPEEQTAVVATIEHALQPFGPVRTRAWGDVASIELASGREAFSFQIARRSVQLHPAVPAEGTGVPVDSLADLVASKMVALVERGAPRDFRDIYAVCNAGLMTPARCWALWAKRQRLAGSDRDSSRARLAVESHLERIALHRPLGQIQAAGEREAARRLRDWYRKEFVDALVD